MVNLWPAAGGFVMAVGAFVGCTVGRRVAATNTMLPVLTVADGMAAVTELVKVGEDKEAWRLVAKSPGLDGAPVIVERGAVIVHDTSHVTASLRSRETGGGRHLVLLEATPRRGHCEVLDAVLADARAALHGRLEQQLVGLCRRGRSGHRERRGHRYRVRRSGC
jgi:hypothetical protein